VKLVGLLGYQPLQLQAYGGWGVGLNGGLEGSKEQRNNMWGGVSCSGQVIAHTLNLTGRMPGNAFLENVKTTIGKVGEGGVALRSRRVARRTIDKHDWGLGE